jgi:hypothetical protein
MAMAWASPQRNDVAATAPARLDGPQQLTISVGSQARGVLFKESWFDRWHAYINGHQVGVLRAGPDMMYVQFPQDTRFPATVEWRYEKSVADWAGIAVSAVALIALVTWPRWRRLLADWWSRRTAAWVSEDG